MKTNDTILLERNYLLVTEKANALDNLQTALDYIGLDPTQTIGTAADLSNTIISLLRTAFSKTKDEREKHIINAGISAMSILPMADVIKLLKLRQVSKPLTSATIQTTKNLRTTAKGLKMQGQRFY